MNLFKKKALSIKGSALLLVLSLSLAIGVISTALYQSYLHIEIQAIKKNNSIELDLALESLVQYTKKGVSSLWCFDLLTWQDQVTLKVDGEGQGSFVRECSDLSKFLSHKGNVELLLADEKFKQKLRKLVAQKNAETESDDDDITTEVSSCLEASQCNDDEKWIEANIDPGNVSNFNDGHPIKPILQKLVTFSDSVKFKISRLGEKTHNLQGRRWVRISVSVLKSNKLIKELSVEYLMYPRQISSYAFLSANELRLNEDVRSLTSAKDGHTRISQINKSEISQYKGLDVFSPVYVNTNIVLPNKATKFSPVHFKAPVILGKGILKRDETDGIKAFSSTDETKFEKKYYTSVDGVSGFSGGIEIRGKKDDGLEKLSDTSIEVNYDSIYQCVGKSEVSGTYSEHQIFTKRDNGQYDSIENPMEGLSKAQTQSRIRNHSKLMIKPISEEQDGGDLTLKYRLRLTPPNRFRSLPFNSKNGESISGITESLKSILSLRLLSWKEGSKPNGGYYTFNQSKSEDKVFLSWKDAYGGQFINTPVPESGTTPYDTSITGASHVRKGNYIYFIGGTKVSNNTAYASRDVWRSENGVNWTRISQSIPAIREGKVIVKSGSFYAIATNYSAAIEDHDRVYQSSDGITWNNITASNLSNRFSVRRRAHFFTKGNYMYVIGGGYTDYNYQTHQSTAIDRNNDVWRSTDGRQWTRIYAAGLAGETLRAGREYYSAILKGDFIYFIGIYTSRSINGGLNLSCDTPYASVWKYKISTNSWHQVPNTTLTTRNGARLFMAGNRLYAMGGRNSCVFGSRKRKDLWSSIDGIYWEQVNTEGKLEGDEIPLVKEDGSVHFFKDGVSKFNLLPYNALRDSLKIETSPVKEEGFEDSYKNNEIDLKIRINRGLSYHRFNFRSGIIFGYNNIHSHTGFIRSNFDSTDYYQRGTSTHSENMHPDFFALIINETGNSSGHVRFYAKKPLCDKIKKIKVRLLGSNTSWRTFNFTEASVDSTRSGLQAPCYKQASNQGFKFNASFFSDSSSSYEVEFLVQEEGNDNPTKKTKFALDFLPYTLGSDDQLSKTEEQYWSSQHKDFGVNTTGASSRKFSLGRRDKDPSVFSALFKFDPRDFGTDTDTYEIPAIPDPSDNKFTITTEVTHTSVANTFGYLKRNLEKTHLASYNKVAGSITGNPPSGLAGINRHNNSSQVWIVFDTYPDWVRHKGKKLRINGTDYTLHSNQGSNEQQKRTNVDGFEFYITPSGFFTLGQTYEMEFLGGAISRNPTGSLYHDKGANLGNTCETRRSAGRDPGNDNNYIYKSADQLAATNGKTDSSYKDWMTIGKSYYENTNSMKLCAYKSTEEDINGIQTTPCDEKAENKPNPFDALWEEDFLDYTKKSWNFFCSGANGDNAQVRRLSADKEVCTVGLPNTFTFRAAEINSSRGYVGFATKQLDVNTNYNTVAGEPTSGSSFPSGLYMIRTGSENQIYYTASTSFSAQIETIKIRKKADNGTWEAWVSYPFGSRTATAWVAAGGEWKGALVDSSNKLEKGKEYEVQIIKKNESTAAPRGLSEKEYCAYCKPKETLCIGSGSTCDFTISNNLVSKKTNNSAPQFQKRGLYKKCVVNSSADFVAGFFVCEEFYVASRTKPLNIIGTVVAGKIDIHKQALKKGVSWMSIYHPKAVKLLQDNGILFSSKFRGLGENREIGFTEECKHLFDFNYRNDSIWNAKNHDFYKANSYTCSPTYLTDEDQGNPFSWTQVNPDCIQKRENPQADSQILCKGRKKHFFMNEISRYLE